MKSRVRVSSISISIPWILLFQFLFIFSISATKISYHNHCNSIVPESTSNGFELDPLGFIHLQGGFFTGGNKILAPNPLSSLSFSKSVNFLAQNVYKTETDGILKIQGTLIFRGGSMYSASVNSTVNKLVRYRQIRPRKPKIYHKRGKVSFELEGFWSESAGKLCMVGTGFGYSKEGNFLDLSVVFKLNYPKMSNISTSLVVGTVESVDALDSFSYFDPISVVGYSQKTYEYTMITQAEKSCSGFDDGEKSLGLESESNACSMLLRSASGGFQLDYGTDCNGRNCSLLDGSHGFLPRFMTIGGIQCSDNGRLRMYLGFSNSSYYTYNVPLDPERTLVGEGIWNGEKNRLCVVGCRLFNFTDSLAKTSVGDCTIRLTLRFPAVLSIRVWSMALGRIWSNRKANESGYFERISLWSLEHKMTMVPGLKYEYTELDRVHKSCGGNKAVKSLGKRYPDGYSFLDMRFDMSVRDSKGRIAWGYSTPLSVGDRLYENPYSSSVVSSHKSVGAVPFLNQSLLNISYLVSFTVLSEYNWGGLSLVQQSSGVHIQIDIAAEGVYDAETGTLCMLGCRHLGWSGKKSTADSMDCEILINVEFSPLDPEAGNHLKGTIGSTREKTDRLYFESLEMSSNVLYVRQAKESIWRIDLEIAMVLISLTLACVFIGLQLLHVKRHPDVLPSISIVMLIVLTLGHMIPLILNFEAFFFGNRNRQNVLLWSGGWLEVNEVIVRLVTMVAFLLQIHLLHLTWSARLAEESKKGLWVAEKKAFRLCFPLYLIGALIALFVHWQMYEAPLRKVHFLANSRHSIWEDLRSYAGLVIDGFLLPQVLLNIFLNSKDKALVPSFYIGTTVVRSLPHAYDAYRAHKYKHLNSSYIYANPGGDLYSTTWDVIIPCGGLLFSVGIYLQQRFGGGCIFPQRFRQSMEYEKVPVISG